MPRCLARQACALRRRLGEPARVARSLLDLVGGGPIREMISQDDSPAPDEPVAALRVVPDRAPRSSADDRLPIDEYESLAASQVVARLQTLQRDELETVRSFEAAHRGRRTILGKIDQLLGMIDPLVRPATSGDVGPLRVLEAEARAGLIDARGGHRWLQEHPLIGERWPQRVADGVLVAVLDLDDGAPGLVVGYLVLDVELPIARIDQVYVTPDARELGYGDALLEAAMATAVEVGAHVIEGTALPGDRDTKNLYERAGITARSITVSRPLP